MNLKCLVVVLAATLVSGISQAQTTQSAVLEDFKPSSLNQPGQEYPQVNSQGYARFKIKAPKADSVKVSLGLGGRGGTKLKKGDDGFFTGTTEGPMDEGFHYYHLTVDGGVFNDRLPLCSRILVQTDHYLRKEITRYRLPPGVGLKIIGTFVTGDR